MTQSTALWQFQTPTRRAVLAAAALGAALATGSASWAADPPVGKLRFAEQAKLVTMDPHKHSGGGIGYLRPVYETLFAYNQDGKLEPLLATGYREEGLSVRISLRRDVKFSDGTRFDAKAVVANLNRGIKVGLLAALKPIAEVVETDEFTVTIKLKSPNPSIIADLSGGAGMMMSPKALDDPALDRNPVGTGPFLYSKTESREGELRVYTANPNYWDPNNLKLARFEILELPDDTARLNALKTGQVDLGIWLANPQAAIIERTAGLKLVRIASGYSYHLVILDREGKVVPAFADKRVRQAMNFAIDRAAYSKTVEFGLSVPAYQPYPPGNWPSAASVERRYEYNPAKAKALLAEAGYAQGFTFNMPSIPIFQSRLQAVAGFLKDVGITMNIAPVEPGTLARRSQTTDFPATNLVWNTMADPKFLSSFYVDPQGTYNPFKAKATPELMQLGEDGLKTADPDKRAPAYRKMAELITDDSYLIFITATPQLFGVSEAVAKNPTVKFRPNEDTVILRGLAFKN